MYNDESPLRTDNFVTSRITKALPRIAVGQQDILEFGDIEVTLDWGWAPDYLRAMRLMFAAEAPKAFVLAIDIFYLPTFVIVKVFAAVGIRDSRAAYLQPGWRHTVHFDAIAAHMVQHDVALLADPEDDRGEWNFDL